MGENDYQNEKYKSYGRREKATNLRSFHGPISWYRVPRLSVSKEKYK